MTRGERIKQSRERAGITQIDLAEAIGVSKQTLYKYENNIITNIPLDIIPKIATAVGVTPEYIMGWDSDSPAVDDFAELYEQLDADDRRAVKDFARFKLTDEKYRKKTDMKIS